MGRRTVILMGVALVVGLVVASIMFRAVPQPIIEIKGETLWSVTLFSGGPSWLGVLEIRNTLLTSWFIVGFLVLFAFFSGRNLKWLPSGWQNFIESLIEGIQSLLVNTAGEKNGRRFFWVIATFFIYIAVTNWFSLLPVFNVVGKVEPIRAEEGEFHENAVVMQSGVLSIIPFFAETIKLEVDEASCEGTTGPEHEECLEGAREAAIHAAELEHDVGEGEELAILAPYFRSVNTDLMSPLSLAIASAIFVEFWGISALGFLAYGKKFFNFPRLLRGGFMGVIDFFVGILELIAELARLISFSFRLFGNMLAGEILLLVMTFLLPFGYAVLGIFYGLEIFVGAIQAFVFGMLTLVFAMLAVSGHGDEHAEEGT